MNTYPIQYLNLANSNLQLQDLVKISYELKTKQKLDYVNISGNKITSCRMQQKDQDGKFIKREKIKYIKPEEVKEQQVMELVENICDLIEAPQQVLKFLDISEMGFTKAHIRRILKSVKKNQTLRSINFGTLQDTGERKKISYWTSEPTELE